jgi:hypothetical protein
MAVLHESGVGEHLRMPVGFHYKAVDTTAKVMSIGESSNWVAVSTVGGCGFKFMLSNTATTGNFATMRLRARSDVATSTQNTNTSAIDTSASAFIADYGDLIASTNYVQDNGYNQARANHFAVALRACTLCTGTSTGYRYALWVSDYSATNKATTQYLARFGKEQGALVIDGVFHMTDCAHMTYLFKFDESGGYLTDTDTRLQVMTPAGAKYIALT